MKTSTSRGRAGLACLCLLALCCELLPAQRYAPDVREAVNNLTKEDIRRHLDVLASDRYAGRLTGSLEGLWAGDYIASHFASWGLEPGGSDGYFQPYDLPERFSDGVQEATLEEGNRLRLFLRPQGAEPTIDLQLGVDLVPLCRSAEGRVEGHLVFGGFGIVTEDFDSYGRTEVEGAVVLLVDAPLELPGQEGTPPWTRYLKVQAAAARGACAVVFIPEPGNEEPLPQEEELTWPPPSEEVTPYALPAVRLSSTGATQLLAPLQARLEPLVQTIRGRGRARSKAWPVLVDLSVRREPQQYGKGRNVIGIWPGTDPELKDEFIVLSAHYDHIGRGELGRRAGQKGEIFNGADDNASGTSAVLEIAHTLARHEVKLRRSIMFIGFDSEEIGLVGSEHFVGNPTVPLTAILADLNMDMISKGHPTRMYVGGRGTSDVLDAILERIARRFRLTLLDRGMERALSHSDQAHFIEAGIPAIFLYGGSHPEYHTPDDDADSPALRPKKMETIARLMLLVAVELSERDERP